MIRYLERRKNCIFYVFKRTNNVEWCVNQGKIWERVERGGGTYELMSKPSNTSSKKCLLFILFGLWNHNMHVFTGMGRNSKKKLLKVTDMLTMFTVCIRFS